MKFTYEPSTMREEALAVVEQASAFDLRRTAQIKIIGNGVAPRQAVAAYRHLLEVAT